MSYSEPKDRSLYTCILWFIYYLLKLHRNFLIKYIDKLTQL